MIDIKSLTQEDINQGLIKVKQIIADNPNRIYMSCVCSSVNDITICDTPLCIGGWLAHVLTGSVSRDDIFLEYSVLSRSDFALFNLFSNYSISKPTVDQANQAIDAYISGNTNNPWKDVK